MTSINSRNTAYDKSTGLTVGITHEDVVEEVRVFLATDERGLSKAVHIEKVTDMYVWFARSGGLRCWVALLGCVAGRFKKNGTFICKFENSTRRLLVSS